MELLDLIPSQSRLHEIAQAKRFEYVIAKPFPHIILDNFLRPEVLERVLANFPGPRENFWTRYDNERERKLEANSEARLPSYIRHLMYAFNTATFLQFLEKLTIIRGLIPDPMFYGAGLHQIMPGGVLDIHTDFNRHPHYYLYRRLNVLIYLNQEWKGEFGGYLELWSSKEKKCVQKIAPIFNRCVVFGTSSRSFHGHPIPVSCPDGHSRKSLAIYYYSQRPEKGESAVRRETTWLGC